MRHRVQVRMHHQGENVDRQAFGKSTSINTTVVDKSRIQNTRTQE